MVSVDGTCGMDVRAQKDTREQRLRESSEGTHGIEIARAEWPTVLEDLVQTLLHCGQLVGLVQVCERVARDASMGHVQWASTLRIRARLMTAIGK
jgi:hypothetical protein